ncbi:MAG: hypothetical protein IJC67_06470, partial [Clostridia bacterium]|nr:hypothetical protein [Clostridia bacterium]
IRKTVQAEGKHKKQSGGHGQYGHVKITFSPGEEDGLTFTQSVVGGAVPKNFYPAVEKGLQEAMVKGVLAGYPMVSLKADLFDGSYHDVDSSEMAFKIAASLAYKDGLAKAGPVLLEPVGELKVIIPEDMVGDVLGDLPKRRGSVMGMDADPAHPGYQIVTAEVPKSEMQDYTIVLRAMTQGKGRFSYDVTRYDQVPDAIAEKVIAEAKKQGGYFMSDAESEKVGKFIMRANGTMNPKIVGKSAKVIADMAGISIPAGTRVLISHQNTVGKGNPYSREKLCPILAFYIEDSWEKACERSIEILQNEGVGHTMTIHSEDMSVIREFALKKPVSRLIVNTPGALGGTGATTGLPPAFTLGCGAIGGSATSDNVGPMNLINIRRVAFGLKELEDIRGNYPAPEAVSSTVESVAAETLGGGMTQLSRDEIEAITKAVIARMMR